MKRRHMLALLGGAAATGLAGAPIISRAQSPDRKYRVGVLSSGSVLTNADPRIASLIRGLAERGYREDRNLIFERRGADANMDRLPQLAGELIDRKVDVILTFGYPAANAAKQATRAAPIVVIGGGDVVETGLIDSLARPGGNVTGFNESAAELSAKRLELLTLGVPGIKRVATLWNADDLAMTLRTKAIGLAAQSLGIAVQALGVREPNDFDEAFSRMDSDRPDAILMVADALTILNRGRVIEFAATHRLPSMFESSRFVREGGLMSYGYDSGEIGGRAASMMEHIFKGKSLSDLPVEQPSHYELIVSVKTGAALGLSFPLDFLARADEIIE
jgi:putative tryptophan/tyrosine transport system substrate-binding protein